ncbi:ribosomal large subunit pseudouridine synthase B [Candidatus Nitromaritima sp. SCGC AAA799-C22]|nr:ribosomal large subunit pseudouridine synthase B [Candidatus Nitromaritima sp. SCGC AAA799-C22]
MKIRLQKVIADAGLASRREAERWIAEGRVQVNGKVVTKPGTRVDPSADEVRACGKLVPRSREKVYLLLNKPAGVLTTMGTDARGRRTVMDLIEKMPARVFPVGRLDYNTQGALLMTSDGALSKKLLDPKYRVPRTYLVKVRGVPDDKKLRRLSRGIKLDNLPTAPLEAGVHRVSGKNCFLKLQLFEGKNRHVKRICEVIGHPVVRLKRTHFGSLNLTGLPLGAYRFLSPREIRSLESLVKKEPEVTPLAKRRSAVKSKRVKKKR